MQWWMLALALVFAALVVIALEGCVSTEAKQAAADTDYAAEQLACVDKFQTRVEIDSCREGVRIRWGVSQTVAKRLDAGADR